MRMYISNQRRGTDAFANLRRLNSVLDEAFNSWPFATGENGTLASAWTPVCDVFETRDGIKIVAELPGVRAEDVRLSLEHNVLTIRGEKKQQAEEATERVHRYERTYGVFERAFTLPSTVDADRIEASYDAGLLTIVLPKAERAKPREIRIQHVQPQTQAQVGSGSAATDAEAAAGDR